MISFINGNLKVKVELLSIMADYAVITSELLKVIHAFLNNLCGGEVNLNHCKEFIDSIIAVAYDKFCEEQASVSSSTEYSKQNRES